MDTEIELFLQAVDDSLGVIAACLESLDEEAIRWQPLPAANCLAVIAKHAMANAHRNVLAHFAGEPYDYRRDQEFVLASETAATLAADWQRLQQRMRDRLEPMPHSSLDAMCEHARMGSVTGRAVLLQVARHASEHAGEAELTRQFVLAR
jgi:Protein of unknown function (DUF664)